MRVGPTAGSWVFDRNRFSSGTWPTPLAPAPKSIVFCTFGQTMVQKHGPTLSRKSDLKGLQVLCGQTFVQKRPFQGEEPGELGVLGLIDDAHAPATQFLDDPVVGNGLAQHRRN